jgi:hypothetical protein
VAAYLHTFAFEATPAQAEAPASTPTAEVASATQAGTPSGTEPAAATNAPTTVAQQGFGAISGTVENKSGTDLPANLKVTLHAYEHGTDPSTGPTELFTQDSIVNSDGTYTFSNVEMPENRIFIAEIEVDGIKLQSGYGVVKAGDTALTLPVLTIYGMTTDPSALVMDEVRLFMDYSGSNAVQYFGVYSFRNPSDKTILIDMKNGAEIPFIKTPEGTTSQGYEALQDSQPFTSTDKGLAIPPSDKAYGLISFTTVSKSSKIDISQPFVLPVTSLTVFLPQGMKADSTALTDAGVQNIQNMNFQVYTAQNVPSGGTVQFTVSGQPKDSSATSTAASTTNNKGILFGAGAVGVAFIAAGAWLYFRERNRVEENTEDEENAFESSDEVLDAIVALDDLHRAKKISDEAYQKRRGELKDILKGMM